MKNLNVRKKLENDSKAVLRRIVLEGDKYRPVDSEREALEYCTQNKYADGIVATRMIAGNIVIEIGAPRLNSRGLEFLHPKRDTKFIISTIIAVVAIALNVLQFFCS